MSYVDGYVLPVPKKNLAAYRRMARDAGKVWMKNGALQYVETRGRRRRRRQADLVSAQREAEARRGRRVLVHRLPLARPARPHQQAKVMKQFTSDPKWKKYMDPKNMPFDGKRMFWGGFKPIVEL